MIRNVQIGSDIEWFLRNKETKQIVSAEGIIKGSKYEPFFFEPGNKFFATSLDNVSAEGNIPPAKNAKDFYNNIQHLLKYINGSIPKELETVAIPSANIDEEFLQTENAQLYGCEPSLCCYSDEEIFPQPDGSNRRVIGMHLHYSYDNPNHEITRSIVRAIDLYLGVPSILIEPENDRRKTGYGAAGSYRVKPYGGEARVLSSYFSSSKPLIDWCFRNTKAAIRTVDTRKFKDIEGLGGLIQQTINSENKDLAKDLIKSFKIQMPDVI